MKKTLCRKMINGHQYCYLMYRKHGRLVTEYLGSASSPKYKKYLYELTKEGSDCAFLKCRRHNHSAGVPVAYVEDGYLIYEYRNGLKEFYDGKMNLVKVERDG